MFFRKGCGQTLGRSATFLWGWLWGYKRWVALRPVGRILGHLPKVFPNLLKHVEKLTRVFPKLTTVFEKVTTVFPKLTTVFEEVTTVFPKLTAVFEEVTTVFRKLTAVFRNLTAVFEEVTKPFSNLTACMPRMEGSFPGKRGGKAAASEKMIITPPSGPAPRSRPCKNRGPEAACSNRRED